MRKPSSAANCGESTFTAAAAPGRGVEPFVNGPHPPLAQLFAQAVGTQLLNCMTDRAVEAMCCVGCAGPLINRSGPTGDRNRGGADSSH